VVMLFSRTTMCTKVGINAVSGASSKRICDQRFLRDFVTRDEALNRIVEFGNYVTLIRDTTLSLYENTLLINSLDYL
jgi:hypothetical protein